MINKMKYKSLWDKLYSEYKIPFWAGIIIGLMTHMYMFMNKFSNLDDTAFLFTLGNGTTSGRWGIQIISRLLPTASLPWLNGLTALILFIVSACLIIRILNIRSTFFKIIATGLIVTFPSLSGTFCYMFTSVVYAISFLLAVLTVYILQKKGKFAYVFAFGCFVFSLAIYQSYLTVTSTLLLLVIFQKILSEENGKFSVYLKQGLIYFIFLCISVIAYLALTFLVLKLTKNVFCDYAVMAMGSEPNEHSNNILDNVSVLVHQIFDEFFKNSQGLIPTKHSTIITIIGALFSLIGYIRWWIKSRQKVSTKLLSLAVLFLFPISINALYLVLSKESIHTLVLFSFVFIYELMIVIIESQEAFSGTFSNLIKPGLGIVLSAIIAVNIFVGNNLYLKLQLYCGHTYSFYTSLVSEIITSPDYAKDIQVAIIGGYVNNQTYLYPYGTLNIVGAKQGINMYSRDIFIRNFIGFDCNFASDEEKELISQTDEFKAMPSYPSNGSIAKINNSLVIKLGD